MWHWMTQFISSEHIRHTKRKVFETQIFARCAWLTVTSLTSLNVDRISMLTALWFSFYKQKNSSRRGLSKQNAKFKYLVYEHVNSALLDMLADIGLCSIYYCYSFVAILFPGGLTTRNKFHLIYTAVLLYNTVSFLTKSHKRHTIAHLLGRAMMCLCRFNFLFIFCLSHCRDVCNRLLYWSAL